MVVEKSRFEWVGEACFGDFHDGGVGGWCVRLVCRGSCSELWWVWGFWGVLNRFPGSDGGLEEVWGAKRGKSWFWGRKSVFFGGQKWLYLDGQESLDGGAGQFSHENWMRNTSASGDIGFCEGK